MPTDDPLYIEIVPPDGSLYVTSGASEGEYFLNVSVEGVVTINWEAAEKYSKAKALDIATAVAIALIAVRDKTYKEQTDVRAN